MMTLTILTSVWRDISLSFSLGFFWKYTVFGSTGIQHLSLTKGHLNWKTRLTPLASLSTCKGQPWWNSWWNSSYTVRRKGRWAGFYVSFDGHESETDKSLAQDHTNLHPELSTLKEHQIQRGLNLIWPSLLYPKDTAIPSAASTSHIPTLTWHKTASSESLSLKSSCTYCSNLLATNISIPVWEYSWLWILLIRSWYLWILETLLLIDTHYLLQVLTDCDFITF